MADTQGYCGPIEVEVNQKNLEGDPALWETIIIDRLVHRAWSGTGSTPSDSTTKAFLGFLGDRRVREYVR